MKRSELRARPAGYDYLAELRQRCALQPSLLDIDRMEPHIARMAATNGGQERKPYRCEEGIAIIDVSGLLTAEPAWWDETGYDEIVGEVEMAVGDSEVKGILLRVNSFGGEAVKSFEAAQSLVDAGKKKPIWAAVDPRAYSAGYLMASCGERIYVLPHSGGVGSVGVYAMHVDISGMLANEGVKVTFISAGEGKTDGNKFEPLGDSAYQRFKADIDRTYGLFTAHVAKQRGMTVEQVVKLGAHLYDGSERAVGSSLADRVGTLEDAWVEMAAFVNDQRSSFTSMSATSAAMTSTEEAINMALDQQADVKNTAPAESHADVEAARVAGFADAQEIVSLCQLAGKPERAAAFIAEKKTSAQVRAELLRERASADETKAVQNQILPEHGAGVSATSNGLIAACDRLAAEMKGGR